ncbi:hypothetical protein Dimus_023874 [Dionaea muscipula]
MDPPLINEGSFSTTNPSLAEIWPLTAGGVDCGGGVVGLRMGNGGFVHGLMDGFVVDSGGVVVNHDGSIDLGSTVTEEQSGSLGGGGGGGGGKRRRDVFSEDESSKIVSATTSGNELKERNFKQIKISGSRDEEGGSRTGGSGNPTEKSSQQHEPPKDYIHVRARRGQATDSHSLAERARREKISERMKMLQDLVPGCNKVIGKALVLDEIINYIQSLQRQVEFLSMKLEAVNSGMVPAFNGFTTKETMFEMGMLFGPQAAREYPPATEP